MLRDSGFGIKMGLEIRIASLLYADDLVLIAGSVHEMQEMLEKTTEFLKKWRFSVSGSKTKVLACGKGETQGLKNRTWQIGGETVKDVRCCKYLGFSIQKSGLWSETLDSNVENSKNAYVPLYQIGFAEAGLQIGQSAFLWNLFAKPRLLYGAEVWPVGSATNINKLESAQLQGARRIFGKKAHATVIGEALRGDLGWISIQSQIALTKLKFYGYLCRLPPTRLLKKVFLFRRSQYLSVCEALQISHIRDGCWFSEICTICVSLGLPHDTWTVDAVSGRLKSEWNGTMKEFVQQADSKALFSSFGRTSSGLHYAQVKLRPGQEQYIWKHDRRSSIIKFALRSRSYGLQARLHRKGDQQILKTCLLCDSKEDETEEHHLLRCTAFVSERLLFCDTLHRNFHKEFPRESQILFSSNPSQQLAFFLGRAEEDWSRDAISMLDMFLRPFLLALSDKRKRLIREIDTKG